MTIDPALLEPGERLLWSGQPNPLRYAQSRSGISVIAGLAALVVAQVWMTVADRDGNPVPWAGIAFYAVALVLLLSPLLLAWRARLTTYALTDRRALTVVQRPFSRRDVVRLSQVQSVELRARTGGVGDLLFREVVLGTAMPSREGFLAIPDAAKVERLVASSLQPAPRA
jgi:hypothetical protein